MKSLLFNDLFLKVSPENREQPDSAAFWSFSYPKFFKTAGMRKNLHQYLYPNDWSIGAAYIYIVQKFIVLMKNFKQLNSYYIMYDPCTLQSHIVKPLLGERDLWLPIHNLWKEGSIITFHTVSPGNHPPTHNYQCCIKTS